MGADLKAIESKLDHLNGQIESITSRLKSIDDFKEDLALFSNDAFGEIIKFLSDVDFHYRSGDFLYLIKKFLINVRNISKMMDQLQSFTELFDDLGPLAKEVFNDFIDKLHGLERDGFFKTLESLKDFLVKLSQSFTPQEITGMGDSIIRLLKIAGRINKPEYLDKLEKMIDIIESGAIQKEKKVSLLKIFKKARNREILQNVGLTLDYIKAASTPTR